MPEKRGILIILPEQLLSFRLVSLDLASDTALELIDVEHELQNNCRTLIDESDEVLDPKFQLLYTRGNQQNVDDDNDRWEVIQPGKSHHEHQDGPYLILHFLKPDVPGSLLRKVIEEITRGTIPRLPFPGWSDQIRESVKEFVSNLDATTADINIVRDAFKETPILKKLSVLRGLFAHGVLKFALAGKRWLVDYSVHLSRCLMAVRKMQSSDMRPSCLSYYNGELTGDEMRQSFSILMKENDPLVEYHNWIRQCRNSLPEGLQLFSAVNLEDKQSFEKLYKCLRYQKGFSGTNDNSYPPPKSMPQRDLRYILHTNAMVLNQLLREENRKCILAEDTRGHQLTVVELLRLIKAQQPPIQVLIDFGAQILETSNQEVARLWLKQVSAVRAQAAVFFDENDEPIVVDKDGYTGLVLPRKNASLLSLLRPASRKRR
ncbi:uncharacterized protein BDV17DRAFT_291782 [Aspergillus undulatus]|uniref:uncharacterized protein n=1 Tax=Aspergillus undulatus TaxID=1810928 RepID=UPI003CCDC4F5